jgi:hypothetical protein
MKWAVRLLSLLPVLFYVSLWLFNEDVRGQPTAAILFQGLLSIVLLAAWRWEKTAGRLAMIGGLIFFALLMGGALIRGDMPFWAAILSNVTLALPYVALGWLFYSLDRDAEAARVDQADRKLDADEQ